MWEVVRENHFLVGALTGSLAAYLLGLLVGYLKRERKWLGYSIASQNVVKKGHPSLAIKYHEQEISRLDSHVVLLRNIGNIPLTNLPVRVDCPNGAKIVEKHIAAPRGASFPDSLDAGQASIVVQCQLLNPGEVFSIGLTVADAENSTVYVVARAENLTCKNISGDLSPDELLDTFAGVLNINKVFLELARAVSRMLVR